jgi:lipopolysaccharide/colanic/teichoic acid biosynthesis glycosyltransferase
MAALWWHGEYRGNYALDSESRLQWLAVLVALVWIGLYLAGVPELAKTRGQLLGRFLRALVVAVGLFSVLQVALASIVLPRLVVGLTLFGAVIIGGLLLVVASRHPRRLRVAILDLDRRTAEELAAFDVDVQVVSVSTPEFVDVDVLVFDSASAQDKIVADAIARAHAQGVLVRNLLEYFEQNFGCVPRYALDDAALLADIAEIHDPVYARAKRAGDVVGAFALLPVLFASLPIVVLLNLVGNRGKTLFVQERVGRDGGVFALVKFRTMRAQGDRSRWTDATDARITLIGRLYRRLHVDELPQIINVLMGQMSFVGPRPEQVSYVESLTQELPHYGVRHRVRPGITGWAQVHQAYAASVDESARKLQYDLYYVRKQTLLLDASIALRTFVKIAGFAGR